MARVNCYMQASNDQGKDVSLGGRSSSNRIDATFNTDNACHHDVSLRVVAGVQGQGLTAKARIKSHGDDRRSVFIVDLPPAVLMDEGCEVIIQADGIGGEDKIFLPGGFTLAEAIRCVNIVRQSPGTAPGEPEEHQHDR